MWNNTHCMASVTQMLTFNILPFKFYNLDFGVNKILKHASSCCSPGIRGGKKDDVFSPSLTHSDVKLQHSTLINSQFTTNAEGLTSLRF